MTEDTRFALEGIQLPDCPGAETLRVLASHVSVREFTSDPVPEPIYQALLVAARSGSTSNNFQSYSIIRVTDPQKRAVLGELAGGQDNIRTCPLFLLFCPDLYRLRLVCERQGYEFADRKMEMFLQAVVDATIAGQNTAVAAEANGLGIVYIGAIRNRMPEAARVLELPQGVFPLFGMCIGYPKSVRHQVKPRLPMAATVHENTYSTDGLADALDAYDQVMSESYQGRRNSPPSAQNGGVYGWCEHTARRLSRVNPQRSQAIKVLEEMGFEF